MRVVAQDPALRVNGRILTTCLDVTAEQLTPGPCGGRVAVIDYDASTDTLYKPFARCVGRKSGEFVDCNAAPLADTDILDNPWFHAQNVYAIAMFA